MAINALSYIGVNSDKLDDWHNFAVKHLGMQKIDNSSKSLSFKMDNQKQRFSISGEPGDALAFLGWEVEKKSDLQIYANRLDKINVLVKEGNRNLTDKRFVNELIYFDDPAGNRIELVYKPHLDKDPFVSDNYHLHNLLFDYLNKFKLGNLITNSLNGLVLLLIFAILDLLIYLFIDLSNSQFLSILFIFHISQYIYLRKILNK